MTKAFIVLSRRQKTPKSAFKDKQTIIAQGFAILESNLGS